MVLLFTRLLLVGLELGELDFHVLVAAMRSARRVRARGRESGEGQMVWSSGIWRCDAATHYAEGLPLPPAFPVLVAVPMRRRCGDGGDGGR